MLRGSKKAICVSQMRCTSAAMRARSSRGATPVNTSSCSAPCAWKPMTCGVPISTGWSISAS
ncbi:Uncharacterised protein [Bordetella pertussis]|nr:Uncharacterised protein [Bordetella pertussis]